MNVHYTDIHDWKLAEHITTPRKACDPSKRTRGPAPEPEPEYERTELGTVSKYEASSQYKCVHRNQWYRWRCSFHHNSKRYHVPGTFETDYEAAQAHDDFCRKHGLARMSLICPDVSVFDMAVDE